jgi:uncharacterized protein YxeA
MRIILKTILGVVICIAYAFSLKKKHDYEATALWVALLLSIFMG